MEFGAGILGAETPMDGGLGSVASRFCEYQIPQPHLKNGSAYRQNGPTECLDGLGCARDPNRAVWSNAVTSA